MVEFITPAEISESVAVSQTDTDYANTYVENLLKNMGIDPQSVQDSLQLRELAKLVALERACVRLSQTEDSVYLEKAKAYKELHQELERQISPQSLGVQSGASPITAELGRR